ncbi:MAG: DNA repair protein RecN (Recombination protein N) [Puniceicoccaceae bacterium 5H]|nr:MAG: DNA repair protein RecN (Recombination protein N) [Puniceicoccaceae bacterium 5H]
MLHYLRIRNLALIEEIELEFGPGLTAVTGETGAGKSILLGALKLLSGSRGDKSVIRQGQGRCEVEAVLHFEDATEVDARLEALGLPPTEEGNLILQRSIDRKKPARVQINGSLSTVALLQELGTEWIDFHGPGEPQKLHHERWQLSLLDAYGQNEKLLARYGEAYRAWQRKLKQIEQLRQSERLSPDEVDFLQHQIDAIDEAALSEDGVLQLERDFARLTSAQELTEGASMISAGITGEEGAVERLRPLINTAYELAEIDTTLMPLADRLQSLLIEAEDIASEYEDLAQADELDEETAQELQQRMEQWLALQRKYGPDVSVILQRRDEMARRIEQQGDIEGTLERWQAEAAQQEKDLTAQAEGLRESRVRAAKDLGQKASQGLLQLGFKKAQLSIDVVREERLQPHGNSTCQFLFTPNAGQSLQPLNKIASSGETARVMLALKSVLAQVDATPVLVFDEVDANVGGEIAKEVGRLLGELGGQGHQVFCVTHLPQVASLAQAHYLVRKDQTDETTDVHIVPLHPERDSRLDELARMLGDRHSPIAREHAQALLAGQA